VDLPALWAADALRDSSATAPLAGLLEVTGRHPWRPAHIHMIVTAPGFQRLQTHIFDSQSPYLDSDTVFAVKPSLVREFEPRSADDPDRPASISGAWYAVRNDVVLVPSGPSSSVPPTRCR